MDNIDEEYDRLVEHLRDCAKKAESSKTTKRRLSLETLELIHQRGAARAAGNQELTAVLARLCRKAIKEDLKERRAEVTDLHEGLPILAVIFHFILATTYTADSGKAA
ncbi:hypothetical protein NECAME_15320 [Necator americanus]|uniref:Uncharacterized protein n=1 Tax=Necator americanus TaxID=51031 RepID=W2SIP6_NECAM|nr:hypothetical protein NECAME_15320 [Necator americanus]ETN69438.1 hypothetical protein NECAME_15320 [Necator americanus]